MVRTQIADRGIDDAAILDAFRAVPREQFVAADHAAAAYGDHPLPIGSGQTISQPYIVALMIAAAGIGPDDVVLEVGAGSGYAAAVIGRIARLVVGIERHDALAAEAARRIADLGYRNVRIATGDGSSGLIHEAPFDAILVAASGSHAPSALIGQLAPGGRLVMPIGRPDGEQRLVKLTRRPDGQVSQESLGAVRFVPLIGEAGWDES